MNVKSQINVIVPSESNKLKFSYDIIRSHHWPLLDYILFCKQIKAKHIIKDFFTNKILKHKNVKKVCIISNHVPSELIEFKEIATANNMIADIYGINHIIKFVDKELLKMYDLVISIGKTVYYALALGVPVYCYDYFGGYGYIKPSNIEETFTYNFSGRIIGEKKNVQEIYNDIINNYNFTELELNDNRNFALTNFCFEKNMEKILKKLNKTIKLILII